MKVLWKINEIGSKCWCHDNYKIKDNILVKFSMTNEQQEEKTPCHNELVASIECHLSKGLEFVIYPCMPININFILY